MATTMSLKAPVIGAPIEQRALKLQHISHRYGVHDSEYEIFSTKFSCDSQFLAVGTADGQIMVYSSMQGDQLYTLRDPELSYPIGGISWKPTSILAGDA